MSKSVQKTKGSRKGPVNPVEKKHDALTVAAVTAYLEEILTKRPKREPNPQNRTFNVRVTLSLGDTQKLAYYCRKAHMTPSKWLAMKANAAVYQLKETEENYREIHDMCIEVIHKAEPGRAVILTPENAAMLKRVADFFGDGETPDNLVNEFHIGGYATPLDIVEMVIGGNDRPDAENKALLAKARAHFGEEP